MNRKLQEEREKALAVLQGANKHQTLNLSDLRSDKTQYFESPNNNNTNNKRSPFKPSEMSARSTINQKSSKQAFSDIDFDEIMRTTSSEAVKNRYRESVGMGRLSSIPRTADMSLQSSISSSTPRHSKVDNNFWDKAKLAPNSTFGLASKNCSVASDCFKPAEEMAEKMQQDEVEQEQEFATIPRIRKTNSNETNWEGSMRQPEMSFGQYANIHYNGDDAREIFSAQSPSKDRKRVALLEMSNMETSDDSSLFNTNHLQHVIKNYDTVKAKAMLANIGKKANQNHNATKHSPKPTDPVVSGITSMLNSLDFEKIYKLSLEPERLRAEKENDVDLVPQPSAHLTPDDSRYRDKKLQEMRGVKRRSSSVTNETPKSAFDKCMRSKSPNQHKELKAVAATLLKPQMNEDELFKVPLSYNSIRPNISSFNKSPSSSREAQPNATRSPSSREYFTASSIDSSEKLSLPNYRLAKPDLVVTSPSPNNSHDQLSLKDSPQGGLLKRTVSQLSNGSEFNDENLPLRIPRNQMRLSWQSVKLYSTVARTVTIQNGSHKRLHLRVRVEGHGFTVSPREDFRMVSQEARSLEVKFSPTATGASCGYLVIELVANSKINRKVPLFAYGGHAAIRIEGAQKGPIGPAFITLGLMQKLNTTLDQHFCVTNYGTLPGFASLFFEKTKWGDLGLTNSLQVCPMEVRLAPGESATINVRFKANRDEIRKIIALNKEVAIVGEICLISGDDPTRFRVIKSPNVVPEEFLAFLPELSYEDRALKRNMLFFNEHLDKAKLHAILTQIKTNSIALTVTRHLDETLIHDELSMADDSTMNFETFCETNTNRTLVDVPEDADNSYILESKFFKIIPDKITFSRKTDKLDVPKVITVQSTCSRDLYAEAVPSKHDYIAAIKSCGIIPPEGIVEIKVFPKLKAYTHRTFESIYVSVLIGDAKLDVPVIFVD